MIFTCPSCTTRLQLEDERLPAHGFSVRCPKCQQVINAPPPEPDARRDAAGAVKGEAAAPTHLRPEADHLSPASHLREGGGAAEPAAADGEVLRLLTTLLQRGAGEPAGPKGVTRRPTWERRRALVCMGSARGAEVAEMLAEGFYEVCVVAEAAQAVEQMREVPADVLILDEEFDVAGEGSAAITRELNAMRMSDRRRLVFVRISDTIRTGDAHAAFINNANLVVHPADLDHLNRILDKSIRDLNDLYREYNKATGVNEI